MRKSLAGMLVASATAMVLVLGGCGGQKQAAPAQEQTTETEAPAATEQAAPAETTATTTEQTAPAETTATTTEQAAPATDQAAAQISLDDAKAIAFADAGVNEADVTFLDAHLDTDDGITKYDVDFHVGQMEYDYDIDPATGAILKRDSEIDD